MQVWVDLCFGNPAVLLALLLITMVWIDSYFGIPVVLLTLLLIMINVMSLFHSQKSNKAGEKKFRRLQCVAMEEQAKSKAKWEEESKMLK
jgi:hypothetical protein